MKLHCGICGELKQEDQAWAKDLKTMLAFQGRFDKIAKGPWEMVCQDCNDVFAVLQGKEW